MCTVDIEQENGPFPAGFADLPGLYYRVSRVEPGHRPLQERCD